MISTLIVEDDYHVATIHAAYVRKIRGFSVAGHASSVASARREIRRLAPTLVLLDLYLPDGHGLELVREALAGKDHRPDFLVITAARDMASVRAAMQLGTVHYLVKPFSFAQLEERLNAYRDLRGRIERIDEAEQHDVDALYGLLRGPAPLPKGQSGPTMARDPRAAPGLTARRVRGGHRRTGRNQPLDRPALPRRARAPRQDRASPALRRRRPPGASLPDGDHHHLTDGSFVGATPGQQKTQKWLGGQGLPCWRRGRKVERPPSVTSAAAHTS